MIDDQNFDRRLRRHKLKPELLLECREDVWDMGIRPKLATARIARPSGVGNPFVAYPQRNLASSRTPTRLVNPVRSMTGRSIPLRVP